MAQADMLYDAQKKSLFIAYLFLLFVGSFGAHRFYLKRKGSGLIMLACTVLGFLTVSVGIGAALLVIVTIWTVVDAVLLPGIAREYNTQLAYDLGANTRTNSVRIG